MSEEPTAGQLPLQPPVPPPLPPVRPTRTQVLLFLATVLTTLVMFPLVEGINPLAEPEIIGEAVAFSATLLTILGVHEMGHFVVGRRHRVDVSLPYFIPAPNLLGTFGAVIRIRTAITDRRALLEIGAAGPLAGFLVAVPAVVFGIARSEVGPLAEEGEGLVIGGSLLFYWLIGALHGPLPEGSALSLNGMAFAGWAGLFLTSFNLLPLGQLDGGHILYALLGRRSHWVAIPLLILLLAMGVFLWPGWAFLCVLVLVFGWRHPPVAAEGPPLRGLPVLLALTSLVILVLCFAPVPILAI